MQTSRTSPIWFLALVVLLFSVTASRLVRGQSTTSQDVGNIHVMIAEGETLSSATPPRLNTMDAARQFYASHGDDFDVLVYFTNFVTADEAEGFFYEPLRNAVMGIGEQQFDPSDALTNYGSASRLKGSVFQGNLSIYQADLNAPIADGSPPGQDVTTLTILGQEVLHRFGVVTRFDSDPGAGITPSSAMLGRSANHWSFFLETQASVFDGLQWRADSSTTFTALDSFERFSQLDLYLIGAKPASEIAPWFLIENVGPAFSGTVQSVTTDEFPVLIASQNFGADASLVDNILIVNQGTAREQTYAISDNAQDTTDTSLGRLTLATKGTGDPPTGVDINAGDAFVVTFDAVGPVRHKVATVDTDGNVEFTSGSNITVTGTRRDITINDVIAVEGARIPVAAEGRTFKVAFILLQQTGSSINQTEVTKLDDIRKGFVTWFNDQDREPVDARHHFGWGGDGCYRVYAARQWRVFLLDGGHRDQYHYRLRQNPARNRPNGACRPGDIWIYLRRRPRFRGRRSSLAVDPERQDLCRGCRSGQYRVGHRESRQRDGDDNIQFYRFDRNGFREWVDHDCRGGPDCEVPEPGPVSTVATTSMGRSPSTRMYRFPWSRFAVSPMSGANS